MMFDKRRVFDGKLEASLKEDKGKKAVKIEFKGVTIRKYQHRPHEEETGRSLVSRVIETKTVYDRSTSLTEDYVVEGVVSGRLPNDVREPKAAPGFRGEEWGVLEVTDLFNWTD